MKKKRNAIKMNVMRSSPVSGKSEMENWLTEEKVRQLAHDTAPIGVLAEHLKAYAYNEEEQYAAHAYCTMIAFYYRGLATAQGRRWLARGFANGRDAVLYAVNNIRIAQAL